MCVCVCVCVCVCMFPLAPRRPTRGRPCGGTIISQLCTSLPGCCWEQCPTTPYIRYIHVHTMHYTGIVSMIMLHYINCAFTNNTCTCIYMVIKSNCLSLVGDIQYIHSKLSCTRQLLFSRKSDCLGCAVLLCLVCLFDLACFFLSSFSSLI